MKKTTIVGIVLMAALSLSAKGAKNAAPREPDPGSREAFEVPFKAAFAGKTVEIASVGAERAEAGFAGEWTFALPVEDDGRLRFVRATFRDGAFEKGTIHYYGLDPQALTADEFAGLRARHAMIAAPSAAGPEGEPGPSTPSCTNGVAARLLAPTTAKWAKPVPLTMCRSVRIAPFGELYGSLLDALPRLGVKAGSVAIRVDFTDASGKTEALGTVRNAKKKTELGKDALLARLGEISGLISTRERIDYLVKGSLAYVPVAD